MNVARFIELHDGYGYLCTPSPRFVGGSMG